MYCPIAYFISFITFPGLGSFKGLVAYRNNTMDEKALLVLDIKFDRKLFMREGEIIRNNEYGNTSYCVDSDRQAKKYCYCNNQK